MPRTKTKTVSRQLRLTTPVNAKEKKLAERLARDEGYASVAELVRQLLSKRHLERRKKALAKKARAEKKNGVSKSARPGLAAKSRNPLALGASRTTRKPTRLKTAKNSTTGRAANSTPKKSLKRRVVSAANKPLRRTSRSTRSGTST